MESPKKLMHNLQNAFIVGIQFYPVFETWHFMAFGVGLTHDKQ